MSETKERIRNVAEVLFFEQGIANTRLQQIADDAGISVGNLAYHFRNKEAIVIYIYDYVFEELTNILSGYLKSPDLRDFDWNFDRLYHFFVNNTFYLNNAWEIQRSFPDIRQKWHAFNTKIILQLRKRIEFNEKRGIMQPEPYKNAYDQLAQTLWMTLNYWIPQQMLQEKKTSSLLYRKALWAIIYPFLTPKGRGELESLVQMTF